MARERTADDQVLALLARSAVPLAKAQIAELLGWAKSWTGKVLDRMQSMQLVDVDPGTSSGTNGRPSAKYSLKASVDERRPGVPPVVRFEPDTFVITPSGNEARVLLHRRDGFVEIENLSGPRSNARTCIHFSYLKAFQPGRSRPTPVVKT